MSAVEYANIDLRSLGLRLPETNKNFGDPVKSCGRKEPSLAVEESARQLNNKKLDVICNCQRLESFNIGMETNRRVGEV